MNNATVDAGCDNLFIGEVRSLPPSYCHIGWSRQFDADGYTHSSLQPLCLGITGQDCQVTHVVVSGDNCQAIAQAAGTTYDIILANNPNVNSQCTNIYPGEVIPFPMSGCLKCSSYCILIGRFNVAGVVHRGRHHCHFDGLRLGRGRVFYVAVDIMGFRCGWEYTAFFLVRSVSTACGACELPARKLHSALGIPLRLRSPGHWCIGDGFYF